MHAVVEQVENQNLSELKAEVFSPETDMGKESKVAETESELLKPCLPETKTLPEIVEPEEEEEVEV
jgi:hypothetical protein